MKLCRKEYEKPATFPDWAAIRPELADKRIYYPYNNGIKADFTEGDEHSNHIEMAGFFCSSIISYRVLKDGSFDIYRFSVFPSLRVNPNNTHGSLCENFNGIGLRFCGERERLESVCFNGILSFISKAKNAAITRKILPFTDKKALLEQIEIKCCGSVLFTIEKTASKRIVECCYTPYDSDIELNKKTYINGIEAFDGEYSFRDETAIIQIVYSAECIEYNDIQRAIQHRSEFIEENANRLKITTPDEDINLECLLTKLRASESIFHTKNGLMHSPGGGNYYAALWTNDECEYANPFFAYLGYGKASEQNLNCFDLFSRLVHKDKAVLTSICAEGEDFWNGAGDRGDTSMFVYGFSRYLLTTGDRENGEKYLPILETACDYIISKINEHNVVVSDSDELENRFESGKANLSTAVITYDAFISMAHLEKELENYETEKKYKELSLLIKQGIEDYFEDEVEGFETYRYCLEETNLRSWICLPLTVGINSRKEGTVKALKSDKLKKPCGLLTRSGENTYWDRSLLYALRGIFRIGEADTALEMLKEYTFSRLYCGHTPYPFEAFPEGNAAQLSAESALYVRIITEGILGFRPTGFKSFEIQPSLPEKWTFLKIERFVYSAQNLDFLIEKCEGGLRVRIEQAGADLKLKNHQKAEIFLS